jgi:hypothetical protein
MTDRQEIGDLIYSIAKGYIEDRVFQGVARTETSNIPYYVLQLDEILTILRQTLKLMGLPENLNFKSN